MEEYITLNNREFIVVKNISYNNNNYIYAIANDDSRDIALVKEIIDNDQTFVESINNKDEFDKVLSLIK